MAVVLLVSGCITSTPARESEYLSQPRAVQVQGPYVHRASGMSFPVSAGPFVRVGVTEYNVDGSDVSASYVQPSVSQAFVTAYIYPAPPLLSVGSPQNVIDGARNELCRRQFATVKRDIEQRPGAKLLSEDEVPPIFGAAGRPGRRAVYALDGAMDERRQMQRSEARLYCYVDKDWLVKYRATGPADVDPMQAITPFLPQIPTPASQRP
jgi:hypothetical protein